MKGEDGKTEELLNAVYHQGEEADAFNRTMIEMVKEREDMKRRGQILDGEKGKRYRRGAGKFGAVAAAILAVIVLGTGVCAATGYFDLDFISKDYGDERGLSEEAKKLVENKPEVTVKEEKRSEEMDSVLDCEVSEVLCDSRYVVAAINVTVKDPERYFYFGNSEVTDPMYSLNVGINSGQKINEYCAEHGLCPTTVEIRTDRKTEEKYASIFSWDTKQRDGKKATIMFCAERLTKDKKFQMVLTPQLYLYVGKDRRGYQQANLDKLKLTVEDKSTESRAEYRVDGKKEYHVPGTTRIIKKVELLSTEVGSYLFVRYEDKKIVEGKGAVIYALSDKTGIPLQTHQFSGTSSARWQGEGVYLSESSFETIGLPEEIYITADAKHDKQEVLRLQKVKK